MLKEKNTYHWLSWRYVVLGFLGVLVSCLVLVGYIAYVDPFSGLPSQIERRVLAWWLRDRLTTQDCQVSPWTGEVVCQKVLTYQAYNSISQDCTQPLSLLVKYAPHAKDQPLLIFTTGTFYAHDEAAAQRVTDYAVAAGATAASVDYANLITTSCQQLGQKAHCIYDSSLPSSAVTLLCQEDQVDCRQGIVVAGVSQGSLLALLSKNYSPLIRGVYAVSTGQYPFQALTQGALATNFSQCVNFEAIQFRPEEIFLVDGEADQVFKPGSERGVSLAQQLDSISGRSCNQEPRWNDCRAEDGSGWYLVANEQLLDGLADHCFPYDGGCSSQLLPRTFDPGWLRGTEPWSLNAGIEFLKSRLEPIQAQP